MHFPVTRILRGAPSASIFEANGAVADEGDQHQGTQGGNLLLEVEYAPHPQFEVDGRNIIHVLALTPWQAALGATVSVPTLGGEVELKIPADSDTGRKLRLRGRGLPGTPPGDQIVELEISAPRAETDEQRKAYARLAKAFSQA